MRLVKPASNFASGKIQAADRMRVVLLRVGVDSGSGGIQGPLFEDNSFEFVPIPDGYGVDPRKYGNTRDLRHGRYLVEYFPPSRQAKMSNQSIHFDPEFDTFTYGDPTSPKAGLRKLGRGDLLVFYSGLEGWGGFRSKPALYLIGVFEVEEAGLATNMVDQEIRNQFAANFHVRHSVVYEEDKGRLVLVKGKSRESRLFRKGHCISTLACDSAGAPLKVLSPSMQKVFGDFGGRLGIQRSPPRWVSKEYGQRAAEYVRSLE